MKGGWFNEMADSTGFTLHKNLKKNIAILHEYRKNICGTTSKFGFIMTLFMNVLLVSDLIGYNKVNAGNKCCHGL